MNVLALCAGAGGLELGVSIAEPGARSVCYVEREAHAAATLVARMEDAALDRAPIWDDVGTFDGTAWRGLVDCITSGDPCQPNSVAGNRKGQDDERWLADQVLRIVEEVRPSRFFRENVTGNAGGQLAAFVPALERMGYRVKAGIFAAAEVGASHRRERLFIMADVQGKFGWREFQTRREGSGRPVPAGSGEGLAHTAGPRRSLGRPEPRGPVRDKARGAEPDGRCSGMADPGSKRRGQVRGGSTPEGGACPSGEILFAPGPSDPRWPEILAAAPSLEPAIRGVADGVAGRVDRLRALGNGVVPLQAAYAWRTLSALLDASEGAGEPAVMEVA